jgi:transketolase
VAFILAAMALTVVASRVDDAELRRTAHRIRVDSLRMTHRAGSGHPGGSMSEADLLAVLYFGGVLRIDPKRPKDSDRDRFILSKGHCCPGLYSVLAQRGFFAAGELDGFRKIGRLLQGHADIKVPGVEMSAGSLGMGLGFGNGVAMVGKMDRRPYRVYVMLGDGECQEGNIWESAMTSSHRGLDNLCAIVDYNKIQIEGFTNEIKRLEPLAERFRSFGWHAVEIDGHDVAQIRSAFDEAARTKGKPTVIVAHTLKGKGVSFTENNKDYHGRSLTDDEMKRAMAELGEAWP